MFTRSNPLFFWWNSLHKITFFASLTLILIGLLISFSLSFAVSEQIGVKSLTFFIKHLVFALIAALIIIIFSFLPPEKLKWFAFLGLFATIVLLIGTLFTGDVKGARRWINLTIFSLQPSEFLKPFFIYISSLLISEIQIIKLKNSSLRKITPLILTIFILYLIIEILLFLQPDFGMVVTFTVLLIAAFFLNLKSTKWFFTGFFFILCALSCASLMLEHVKHRLKVFFMGLENFQAKLAIKAIQGGGLLGKGITESDLKFRLPEAHNDFIFAIILEEFGFIFAGILGLLFLLIIFSNFLYIFEFKEKLVKVFKKEESFSGFAYTFEDEIIEAGIKKFHKSSIVSTKNYTLIYKDFLFGRNYIFLSCVLLFFEFFMNAAVSLNLVPTKGMGMPFISYGGSSLISHALLVGILLTFNRKRYFFLF